jgi:hypothetical protein
MIDRAHTSQNCGKKKKHWLLTELHNCRTSGYDDDEDDADGGVVTAMRSSTLLSSPHCSLFPFLSNNNSQESFLPLVYFSNSSEQSTSALVPIFSSSPKSRRFQTTQFGKRCTSCLRNISCENRVREF